MHHDMILSGWGVTLRPATTDDARRLHPKLSPELWKGMATPFPQTADDFARQYRLAIDDPLRLCFSVIFEDELVGRTMYYDYLPGVRTEVGSTFYLPKLHGSVVNPACKYLLFDHAFTELNIHRIGLRCDMRNRRSARAIAKLGATYEGVARQYRRDPEGNFVDTNQFSIIKSEWPMVQARLLQRLDAAH
ncbi:MAG: GNAT family protein [Actinomycetaceae bacterium]|nr:GNAT family protein [Actinomycetaceae bacterium]